jgi:hypothetical protein
VLDTCEAQFIHCLMACYDRDLNPPPRPVSCALCLPHTHSPPAGNLCSPTGTTVHSLVQFVLKGLAVQEFFSDQATCWNTISHQELCTDRISLIFVISGNDLDCWWMRVVWLLEYFNNWFDISFESFQSMLNQVAHFVILQLSDF